MSCLVLDVGFGSKAEAPAIWCALCRCQVEHRQICYIPFFFAFVHFWKLKFNSTILSPSALYLSGLQHLKVICLPGKKKKNLSPKSKYRCLISLHLQGCLRTWKQKSCLLWNTFLLKLSSWNMCYWVFTYPTYALHANTNTLHRNTHPLSIWNSQTHSLSLSFSPPLSLFTS